MIKLRLKRFGKKKEASFRIVACNSTLEEMVDHCRNLVFTIQELKRQDLILRP